MFSAISVDGSQFAFKSWEEFSLHSWELTLSTAIRVSVLLILVSCYVSSLTLGGYGEAELHLAISVSFGSLVLWFVQSTNQFEVNGRFCFLGCC